MIEQLKNKIINADCMDILKQLPDKSIDLLLTDPPYGSVGNEKWDNNWNGRFGSGIFLKYFNQDITCERTGGGCSKTKYDNKILNWDFAPSEEVFEQMFRVSKNQIIWGGNYFSLPPTRCFLVWDKLTISEKFSMAMCEYAWTSFNKNAKRYEIAPQDRKRFHPTQKPLKLIEWCVANYSKEGELILDCFSGSGTTAIACHNLKRNFICIERDADYYNKSVKRLEQAQSQLQLF